MKILCRFSSSTNLDPRGLGGGKARVMPLGPSSTLEILPEISSTTPKTQLDPKEVEKFKRELTILKVN
jgi:hypothetical protein